MPGTIRTALPNTKTPLAGDGTQNDYVVLFEREFPKLMRVARRLAWPDSDLAADLVQGAAVKGLRALRDGKFSIGPNSSAWLKQAVVLEYLVHRRSSRSRPQEALHDIDTADLSAPMPFYEQIDPDIIQAIYDLPADQRDLVILVDLEQLDYREAGQALGIPLGTVRSRLSRARWKLANRLRYLLHPER